MPSELRAIDDIFDESLAVTLQLMRDDDAAVSNNREALSIDDLFLDDASETVGKDLRALTDEVFIDEVTDGVGAEPLPIPGIVHRAGRVGKKDAAERPRPVGEPLPIVDVFALGRRVYSKPGFSCDIPPFAECAAGELPRSHRCMPKHEGRYREKRVSICKSFSTLSSTGILTFAPAATCISVISGGVVRRVLLPRLSSTTGQRILQLTPEAEAGGNGLVAQDYTAPLRIPVNHSEIWAQCGDDLELHMRIVERPAEAARAQERQRWHADRMRERESQTETQEQQRRGSGNRKLNVLLFVQDSNSHTMMQQAFPRLRRMLDRQNEGKRSEAKVRVYQMRQAHALGGYTDPNLIGMSAGARLLNTGTKFCPPDPGANVVLTPGITRDTCYDKLQSAQDCTPWRKATRPRCGAHGFCLGFEPDGQVYCYGDATGCLFNRTDCRSDADCDKYTWSSPKWTDDARTSTTGAPAPSCGNTETVPTRPRDWQSGACERVCYSYTVPQEYPNRPRKGTGRISAATVQEQVETEEGSDSPLACPECAWSLAERFGYVSHFAKQKDGAVNRILSLLGAYRGQGLKFTHSDAQAQDDAWTFRQERRWQPMSLTPTEISLRHTEQFFDAYRGVPKFALVHEMLNHGMLHARPEDDDAHTAFFQAMIDKHGNSTVMFFVGDHGMNPHGQTRAKVEGAKDIDPAIIAARWTLPAYFVIVPAWFAKAHPAAARALRQNQERLVTPLDVYSTIRHMIVTPDFPDEPVGLHPPQGTSLFEPIPDRRSCEAAGIQRRKSMSRGQNSFACICDVFCGPRNKAKKARCPRWPTGNDADGHDASGSSFDERVAQGSMGRSAKRSDCKCGSFADGNWRDAGNPSQAWAFMKKKKRKRTTGGRKSSAAAGS